VDLQGWVSDRSITVLGYTGFVSIIQTPLRDGSSITAGTVWNPTPNPDCLPSIVETQELAFAEAGDGQNVAPSGIVASRPSFVEATGIEPDASTLGSQISAEFGPSGANSTTGTLTWVLVTGVIMLITGTVLYTVQQRSR
jgi:hypothetical protein